MVKRIYTGKINWSAHLIFVLGVLLIVYFSWKSNPNLKELEFIPDWLSNWTDQERNNQTRTAVPLLGLGLYTSVNLIYAKQKHWFNWVFAWVVLDLIVCIAEIGQFLLPSRTPDLKDILWGVVGAAMGLAIPFLSWHFITMFKAIRYGTKKD